MKTGYMGFGWYYIGRKSRVGRRRIFVDFLGGAGLCYWHENPCGWRKLSEQEISNLVKE